MDKLKYLNFNPSAVIPYPARGLTQASAELFKSFAFKRITPLSLVALLGLGGVSWVVINTMAPQIAQAYTARVDITLNSQIGESYEAMVRRAESIARAAAQRSFDGDILVTDVSVTILGQNQGSIAPILTLDVTRQGWRSRPDPQRWARYFPSTRALLGFREGTIPEAEQPPAPPQVPTPQQPGAVPPGTVPIVPGSPTQPAGQPGAVPPAGTVPPAGQPGGGAGGTTNNTPGGGTGGTTNNTPGGGAGGTTNNTPGGGAGGTTNNTPGGGAGGTTNNTVP